MGHVITDYTVPASACELFSLALNLVASYAHDPQQHCKFLVVHLDHSGHRSTMPVELRGCKTLILPRDLEKLHQISSRKEVTNSSCRFESYCCKDSAGKVRHAVQQLDKRKGLSHKGRKQEPKSSLQAMIKTAFPFKFFCCFTFKKIVAITKKTNSCM